MPRDAPNADEPRPDDTPLDRRAALRRTVAGIATLAGASALLGGCASGSSSSASADLPEPVWPTGATPSARRATAPAAGPLKPAYAAPSPAYAPDRALPTGVIARAKWAGGQPVPSLMDRMLPVRRITLHHDGMSPFTSTAYADAAERVENIRRAHRGNGWGDVGYHYLIDPAGRVWQGRPLRWQGAHVGGQNENNLGICVLGNFQDQRPSRAQVAAVEQFVASQMRRYGVRATGVFTHRELAATACPGRNLQPALVAMRAPGGALRRA